MSGRERAAAEEKGAPQYQLFGEPPAQAAWIANVEPLAQRCRDRGWVISPHSHPNFLQIVFVRSGRGEMTSDDRTIRFESPCVIAVPPRHIHGFAYEKDSDGWVLTIADYFLARLLGRVPELARHTTTVQVIPLYREGDVIHRLADALLNLDRELKQKSVGHLVAVEIHVWSALLVLMRYAEPTAAVNANRTYPKIVESFRALVEERFRQNVALSDLATELGISQSQLRAACMKTVGLSPMHIIHQRLLQEAKRELLFGDLSVEQLAYWLGFASASYFTRFFKQRVAMSPGEFRTTQRNASRIASHPDT